MRITLSVNGQKLSIEVAARDTLLEALRQAGFTEVKFSCGRGECGVCAVKLNGRAVNSCMVIAASCDGAEIVTAAGFGSVAKPNKVQEALVRSGGVQCGYCTPGFVSTISSLLEGQQKPRVERLEKALDGHMCRCTGYIQQKEALEKLVSPVEEPKASDTFSPVGKRVIKRDALAMACGNSHYCDDELPKRVLSLALVCSQKTHAKVVSIDSSEAKLIPGVADVITCFDVPERLEIEGPDLPESMLGDNFLFTDRPRYNGDKIAAVVAENDEIARKAASLVKVELQSLPAAVTLSEALEVNAPSIGPAGNIVAKREFRYSSDDISRKTEATKVSLTTYTPAAHPCFSEPYSCLAWYDERARLNIRSSTQVPYFVRWIVSQVCSIPVSQIRVIKPQIGGGFGAKQDVVVEAICALATKRVGRPVRLVMNRQEVFRAGRYRHPAMIKLDGSVDGEHVVSLKMDVTLDKGAYSPHGASLLLCCISRSLPLYKWSKIELMGRSVLTNKPSAGGVRGYGAPQSVFAMETLVDELARKASIDPLEFRIKNAIGKGDSLGIINDLAGQDNVVPAVLSGNWAEKCLRRGSEIFEWKRKRQEYKDTGRFRRGVGVAWAMQAPTSFAVMRSSATIQLKEDGTFIVLSGAADIGTGAETILAQMAAETLTVPLNSIQVITGDTDPISYDAGAYASSTTWNAGAAVTLAAEKTKEALLRLGAAISGLEASALRVLNNRVAAMDNSWSSTLAEISMEAIRRPELQPISVTVSHGPRLIPPSFNAQFVDLVVDRATGKVKVEQVVSVVDCGRPVNPTLSEGQMYGSVAMGLGMALTEEVLFNKQGFLLNGNFSTYQVMRMIDMPEIMVDFIETNDEGVPFNAKSIGEIGCMPPMPAVGNAIAHATGLRLTEAPFTPWRVLKAIKATN